MKRIRIFLLLAVLIFTAAAVGQGAQRAVASAPQAEHLPPAARVVDLKASDGAILKGSYFAASKPGPGVLLLHQSNRTRRSWDDLAVQMAAAGINTLTLDMRGYGESGGKRPSDRVTRANDADTAFQYLVSQPGVQRDVIGVGGAGFLGVDNAIQVANRHSPQLKSLVVLSTQTVPSDRQFVRQATQLPGLFVVADGDEYPPVVEQTEWLYSSSPNPGKRFIHYDGKPATWLGFEDSRAVPPTGNHGTDLFKGHPELTGIIVDWFVTTLIKTPGYAPADNNGADFPLASILDQLETGGVAEVTQQLTQARQRDPKAQLWPWFVVNALAYEHLNLGETKLALEILKLNFLAYPDSADGASSLSDAFLADGEKKLARQYANKALALLDAGINESDGDSPARRKLIRDGALQNLKQLDDSVK